MKKLIWILIAAAVAGTALQGCGAMGKPADSAQQAEAQSSSVPESEPSESRLSPGGSSGISVPESRESVSNVSESTVSESRLSESAITGPMALKGVRNYCGSAYGLSTDDGQTADINLEIDDVTDSVYQLSYRSYTGAVVKFYVDRTTGLTRVTEYAPGLDVENDAGTFSILDYQDEASASHSESLPEKTGHYAFRPKVCSVYMEEVFGKTMCETWYRLVDAVMAGEDTFACPDQHTYDWVMGQFPDRCFPLLRELIDYTYDREHSVIDGIASYTWKIPKETAARRLDEFAGQVEDILNAALKDDYSDFEKTLALYDYFSRHYIYDYELLAKKEEAYLPDLNTMYFFNNNAGTCQEISSAFSYLLMQAGVEATIMSGPRSSDQEPHQWSYVRIGGHDYHIDPTYAIDDVDSLSYFMMTDAQRFAEDGYEPSTFKITSNYSQDHPHPVYAAADDTFAPLWDCTLETFDPDKNIIICRKADESGENVSVEFDYAGY